MRERLEIAVIDSVQHKKRGKSIYPSKMGGTIRRRCLIGTYQNYFMRRDAAIYMTITRQTIVSQLKKCEILLNYLSTFFPNFLLPLFYIFFSFLFSISQFFYARFSRECESLFSFRKSFQERAVVVWREGEGGVRVNAINECVH